MEDDLKELIAFEDRTTQMFDSDVRVALAVLEEVRKLKTKYNNAKANHNKPLPEDFLRNRGFCCGNKCKHCPYTDPKVKGNTKLKTKYKKE